MARTKPKLDLTDASVSPYKIILWLAWPLFLEQILGTLVSFVDTAMVGSLGVNATASISISNSFVFLLNGAVMSLGVGITAYVARSCGAKDYDAAKAYIRHALIILVMLGVPLVLVTVALHRHIPAWMGAAPEILDQASGYLLITSSFRFFALAQMMLSSVFRGRGDTKTPFYINICINVCNVIGNYLLIFPNHTAQIGSFSFPMIGAGLGVYGAGLSTGISWLLGGSALIVMLFKKNDPTKISVKDSFKPDFALLKRVVTISIPAMLERICMSSAGIIMTKTIASMGTVVVAANSVFSTAESICFMPAFAFQTAITTLVGQSLGAKKPELAVSYTNKTNIISAAIMTFAGAGLFLFAEQLAGFITPDQEAIALAATCLRIVAFIQPIQTIAWNYGGALRGAGDTKWPFYITAASNWAVRVLGSVLLVHVFHMGLPAAVAAMCADNFVRMILMYLRFRSGKWMTAIKDR
ncbi:MAG: MATE family efflux transporter [Eubacteriales bacterium]|nr:MATE family efflux transporter [Eubacteriales bacterium]